MKKLLLVGMCLALLPGVSFADSPLMTGLDATTGQHVPFPIDHTTGMPQIETTMGTPTSPNYTKPAPYTNTGGDISGQSVTTAYTLSCPANSTTAVIEPYGGGIIYRTDGTAASAASPVLELQSGGQVTFNVSPLSNVSIIAISGSGTTIGGECLK